MIGQMYATNKCYTNLQLARVCNALPLLAYLKKE